MAMGGSGGPGVWIKRLIGLALVLAIGYFLYYWEICRVVVPQNHVMVLIKKDGSRSLSGDNIIIPRPPDANDPQYVQKFADWQKQYGDCNGILEQVYPEGTYFNFSPIDYEREVIDISDTAIVPTNKVGIVIKKFGQRLPTDSDTGMCAQVLADPALDQRGPLPGVLQPGRYNQYANPYAYEIKQVDPIQIDPGFRGVVTLMAASKAQTPNQYLVEDGEQGVQRESQPPGILFANPFERRITPISTTSQRFEMSDDPTNAKFDAITFPSADSFDIRLEAFVEWRIDPDKLPLLYVQYGNGGDLIAFVEQKIILPYARSFCRLAGSRYMARDFISGETKLKFQDEFQQELRDACSRQGVLINQALVRNIIPPDAIKELINEREVAREQILQYQQQIKVADSQSKLVTQQEIAEQNDAIGDANKEVVKVTKDAERNRDVALTMAQQKLAVATLALQAAQKESEALVSRGQADANVILLQKQAEADPLKEQVAAFGGGDAYARYFFYQKVAPAMKSILANSDGPFADIFRQFAASPTGTKPLKPMTPTETASH
jgi:regulator of protease activity HflC (stomatin/prohibitin superfamily)